MTPPKERSKITRTELCLAMLKLFQDACATGKWECVSGDIREPENSMRRIVLMAQRADNMDAFFDA